MLAIQRCEMQTICDSAFQNYLSPIPQVSGGQSVKRPIRPVTKHTNDPSRPNMLIHCNRHYWCPSLIPFTGQCTSCPPVQVSIAAGGSQVHCASEICPQPEGANLLQIISPGAIPHLNGNIKDSFLVLWGGGERQFCSETGASEFAKRSG